MTFSSYTGDHSPLFTFCMLQHQWCLISLSQRCLSEREGHSSMLMTIFCRRIAQITSREHGSPFISVYHVRVKGDGVRKVMDVLKFFLLVIFLSPLFTLNLLLSSTFLLNGGRWQSSTRRKDKKRITFVLFVCCFFFFFGWEFVVVVVVFYFFYFLSLLIRGNVGKDKNRELCLLRL